MDKSEAQSKAIHAGANHERNAKGYKYEVRGNPKSGKGTFVGATNDRKDWNKQVKTAGLDKKSYKFIKQ